MQVEWIPAQLSKSQPAQVDVYFTPRIQTAANGKLIGFFRGRELCGKEVTVPEGYEVKMVEVEGDKLCKKMDIKQMRVWDRDNVSLDRSLDFLDLVEISEVLCED